MSIKINRNRTVAGKCVVPDELLEVASGKMGMTTAAAAATGIPIPMPIPTPVPIVRRCIRWWVSG